MKYNLIFVISMFVFSGMGYAQSDANKTGNDIINSCPKIFTIDSPTTTVEETLAAIDCAGYIGGLNDMAVLMQGVFKQNIYCIPETGLENGQVIRVFTKWLEENPESLHESARSLFISAMKDSFPCGN